jgi:dipeptidyl aminopeptidase/acylaminoacyl peptidase
MLFVVSLARRKPARRIILSACGALSLIAVFAFAAPPAPPPVRTVGNLVLDGVPDIPDALAERMQQYQNVRAAGLLDWDPNGQGVLISTRFGETNQLHFVQKPGGARTQLTFFPEPVRSAQWRPRVGDREALLSMDQGGAENDQLYLWRWRDGRSTLLTDGKSRHESAVWSRQGDRIAYTSNTRNGKDFDVYVMNPDDPATARRVIDLEGSWRITDWSPDGSKLLLLRYVSIEESHPFVLDLARRELTRLFPQPKKLVSYGTLQWGEGGRVWFLSDDGGELQQLGRREPDGQVKWFSAEIPWNVEDLDVSRDLRQVAFAVNEDGISRLYLLPPSGKPVRVGAVPEGLLTGLKWRPDGKELGLSVSTATTPGDVFSVDALGRKVARWTQSEVGGLPHETFVAPKLVRYPTFDQTNGKPREIPAFWYQPRAKQGRPARSPFVVHIHGGPEGQARPRFDPTIQFWVNELGVAVLVPNVRGSDGYGRSYLALDNGKLREDSVRDIGALLDWAATQPQLDATRAAVYGGSYGGYMVLASLAKYPDKLRAGVDVVGISHFVTFLENTKGYRQDLRRVEYGDERIPDMRAFLQAISPLTLADRIRAPLLVIQGANDPRVPASEAEQIVQAVRKNGVEVGYLLAKDEGHGFQKKGNRDVMGRAVVAFFERFLVP